MKKLTKTLSLVLVVAMVLSLCVIGAGATFTDNDKITKDYSEAVTIATDLGIVSGVGNNTFAPAGTFTRAQAAVILTRMTTGANAAAIAPTTQTFKDVPTSFWGYKYIEYAAQAGLVAGIGNGKFSPNATLDGYQWALMLLKVLGFDSTGMTPANWQMLTAKAYYGNSKFSSVAITNAAVTREAATQMAFDALMKVPGGATYTYTVKQTGVTYNDASTAYLIAANLPSGDDKTVVVNTITTGSLYGNAGTFNGAVASTTLTSNSSNSTSAYTVVDDKNFKVSTDASLLGHQVNLYYNAAKHTDSKGVVYYDVYGVVDKTAQVAITATMTAAQVKTALVAAGVTADVAANYAVWQNGKSTNNGVAITLGTTTGTNIGASTLLVYNGKVIGAVKADTLTAGYVSNIVTTAGSESIAISGTAYANNATSDVINEYTGIAKGDVVVYTLRNGICTPVKCTTVKGVATAASTASDAESLTVGGTTYTKSAAFTDAYATLGFTTDTLKILSEVTMGTEYTLYLDAAGKMVAISTVDKSVDAGLFYLTLAYKTSTTDAFGKSTPTYWVQGVSTTGTEVKYQVTEDEYKNVTTTVDTTTTTKTGLYTVSTSYNSSLKATVADLTSALVAGGASGTVNCVKVENGAVAANAKTIATGNYFAANVTYIYITGSGTTLKTSTKTGVQAIAANTPYTYYATKATTAANYTVNYVYVAGTPSTASNGTGLIYAPADFAKTNMVAYTDANGQPATAYVQTVYIDGVKTDIKVTDVTTTAGFYKYSVDAYGIYTLTGPGDKSGAYTAQKVTNVYNSLVSFGNTADTTVNGTDLSAANAKIVDLRTAATISTDGIAAISTVEGIASAMATKTVNCAVTVDLTATGTPITVIYVTSLSADA